MNSVPFLKRPAGVPLLIFLICCSPASLQAQDDSAKSQAMERQLLEARHLQELKIKQDERNRPGKEAGRKEEQRRQKLARRQEKRRQKRAEAQRKRKEVQAKREWERRLREQRLAKERQAKQKQWAIKKASREQALKERQEQLTLEKAWREKQLAELIRREKELAIEKLRIRQELKSHLKRK